MFSWLCTKSINFIISGGGSKERMPRLWAISQILQSFDIWKPKDGKSAGIFYILKQKDGKSAV